MKKFEEMKFLIHDADVILEVVDARDLQGTRLPIVERMSGTNRLIIVVNKTDLSEPPAIPKNAIKISAKIAESRKTVINAIMEKTDKRPAKALLIGYPNVGKSSIINMLARKKVARVSAVAGTTRNVQWVKISDDLMVTDYRGVFPKGEKKEDLIRKKAINIDDNPEYGYLEGKRILESRKLRKWIGKKLEISLEGINDAESLLEAIAKRRNLYIRGGKLNTQEAAKILLRALREAPEI
ncbi:50S ribosome-binding GTPase [Candidatus Micrarchaeota archaeon]|nr:50S ribosome-binding GTPase [Candidatus Micrarchaeota archaeon]